MVSTSGASASTASSAVRLAWISEMIRTRMIRQEREKVLIRPVPDW
jgi:hypothetical protein